jgi:tetratricopeptide (TPR) repeat protein
MNSTHVHPASPSVEARQAQGLLLPLLGLGLVGATLAVFAPACANGFVYDDQQFVVENGGVEAGLTGTSFLWALQTFDAANWHPLTWISLQLDSELYGPDPFGYHLTNLLWHCANVLLVLLLFWRLTGAVWPSAFVAALFGLHPLHVESVAWVSERKDVVSTCFGLLAIYAYGCYVSRPGIATYSLLAVSFGLSLLAKPMFVTLPVVLLVLDYWPLQRLGQASVGRLVWEKLPLAALSLASAVITLLAQRRAGALTRGNPFFYNLENAIIASFTYLAKTLWPTDLAAFYPAPSGLSYPGWLLLGAAISLLAITGLVLMTGRRQPYLLVGWLWYLITLLPVCGVVHVLGGHAMADRYTYVPLIGIFMMVAWSAAEYRLLVFAPLLIAGCMIVTNRQVKYWRDGMTLWQHALGVTDANYLAENNLGVEYERVRDSHRALTHYARAIQIKEDYADAHNNAGLLLSRTGDLKGATYHFRRAIEAEPDNPIGFDNLAHLLGRAGDLDNAVVYGLEAVRLDPNFAGAHRNLATAFLQQGEIKAAIEHGRAAVRINPDLAAAHNDLGIALALQGNWQGALACQEKAVALAPTTARFLYDRAHALHAVGRTAEAGGEYRHALRLAPQYPAAANQGAWTMATSADARARNGPLAVYLAEEICEATGRLQTKFLDTLAAAYAESGRFADAVATARSATAERRNNEPDASDSALQGRLKLYEAHHPYHEQRR